MNCSFCRERLDQYSRGKLGNEDKLSFESHLHACQECRKLLNVLILADRIIEEEKKVIPDVYLSAKIMAKISNLEKENVPLLIRFLKPALATISVAAAITAGVLIGNFRSGTADNAMPIELVLMNDAEMESVNDLAAE